ncbi:MAG: hypothetical protein IPI49_23220 [Myxococcales bacterium]|nr:hypothetical protein [Myxococcales bacterium]
MGANLIVTPAHGVFDTDLIREHLEAEPDALACPYEGNVFLLTGHPSGMGRALASWRDDPTRYPSGAAIHIFGDRVHVNQEYADTEEMKSCMLLLRWLTSKYDCNIREDGYADLTERFHAEGMRALYPEWFLAEAGQEWRTELLQIGFFDDFLDSRGGVSGYRLKDCIADTPQEDEDKLVAYLQAGYFYRAFGDPEEELYDVLDHSAEMNLKPALLTDGTYVWATDLPYYVARYHARLPRSFLLHARRNGWQVPQDLDISSLKMLDA